MKNLFLIFLISISYGQVINPPQASKNFVQDTLVASDTSGCEGCGNTNQMIGIRTDGGGGGKWHLYKFNGSNDDTVASKEYVDSRSGTDSVFVHQQVALGLDTFSLNSAQAGALYDTTTPFEGVPNEPGVAGFIPGGGGSPFGVNYRTTGTDSVVFSNSPNLTMPSISYPTVHGVLQADTINVSSGTTSGFPLGFLNVRGNLNQHIINQDDIIDISDVNSDTAGAQADAFNSSMTFKGPYKYSHGANYQARLTYAGKDTMTDTWGYYYLPTISDSGTIINSYGFINHEVQLAPGAHVVNQIGFDCDNISVGTESNWCFYSSGTAKSHFSGQVYMGGSIVDGPDTLTHNLFVEDAAVLNNSLDVGNQSHFHNDATFDSWIIPTTNSGIKRGVTNGYLILNGGLGDPATSAEIALHGSTESLLPGDAEYVTALSSGSLHRFYAGVSATKIMDLRADTNISYVPMDIRGNLKVASCTGCGGGSVDSAIARKVYNDSSTSGIGDPSFDFVTANAVTISGAYYGASLQSVGNALIGGGALTGWIHNFGNDTTGGFIKATGNISSGSNITAAGDLNANNVFGSSSVGLANGKFASDASGNVNMVKDTTSGHMGVHGSAIFDSTMKIGGVLGVGLANPASPLYSFEKVEVANNGATAIGSRSFGSQSKIILIRANGTNTSPTAVTDGQIIGSIATGVDTGTGYSLANSAIGISAIGNQTLTNNGFQVTISNIDSGLTTVTNSVIFKNHHINSAGTTPALSSCGTSPVLTAGSTDISGEFTEGTIATGCTISFANSYGSTPFCLVTEQSGLAASYTNSATGITVTNIGALSSTTLNYFCTGH